METGPVSSSKALVPVNGVNHQLPGKIGQWAMRLDNKIVDTISLTSGKNIGRWAKFSRKHPKIASILKPVGQPILKGLNFIHDKGIGQVFKSAGSKIPGASKVGGFFSKIPGAAKIGPLFNKVPLRGPMFLAVVTDAVFKTAGAVKDAVTVGKEKGLLAGIGAGIKSLGKGIASIAGGALAAAGAVALAGVAATGPLGWVIGGAGYLAGSWLTGKVLDGVFGSAKDAVQGRPYRTTDSLRPDAYQYYPGAFRNTTPAPMASPSEFANMSSADQFRFLDEHVKRVNQGDFRGWY